MEDIKCCLCGKEIAEKYSHDPRPIISNNGNRCCAECNNNIVIPTRLQIWKSDDSFELDILKTTDEIRQANYEKMKEYFTKYNIIDLLDSVKYAAKTLIPEDFISSIDTLKDDFLKGVTNFKQWEKEQN